MELQVIDLRDLRERRAKETEQMRLLAEARQHNRDRTARYISIYGKCFSLDKQKRLQKHLNDLTASVSAMWSDYDKMMCEL